jgi:hypothetical protein
MPHSIPNPPQGKIINRHWNLKTGAKIGAAAGSVGVAIAQTATGTSTLAVLAAAGAGVSATGVGLAVTGGVLTVTSTVVSGRAAYKTYKHKKHLKEIHAQRGQFACNPADVTDFNVFHHKVIANDVLPYVISKKSSKLVRKGASTVPGLSLLEGIRAVSKKGYKWTRGTLGENRTNASMWLANHLLSHNCGLAEAIVAELYSHDEMLWMKYHCSGENAVNLLKEKMKST